MIRSTVIVEGYAIDLTEDIDTDFTYSIQDIREPDKRTTDFSKTIDVPGTPKNNALFAHIFDLNVENQYNPDAVNIGYNFNPNKVAKTQVLVDGIQVFNGVIRILKITQERGAITYETNVLGRLSDILFAFGDKKLADIDFSDMDVSPTNPGSPNVLSVANLQQVWNNPSGYRYTYPLIDYGLSLDGIKYPIEGFAPAIYVKEYLDRMFAQAGFTYNCSFFNIPYFQNLIIPSTEKNGFDSVTGTTKFLECNSRQLTTTGGTFRWYEKYNWWYTPKPVDKYGFITITSTNEDVGNHIRFTRDLETSVQFVVKYLVTKDSYINVRLNDEKIAGAETGSYAVFYNTVIIEIPKQKFKAGDHLRLSIDINKGAKMTFSSDTKVLMPSPTDDSAYPVDEGAEIHMNNFVSKSIAQKDFFKSIILMHNLYVFTDPDNDKNLFIVPQNQFYNTIASDAVDWTDKIDYSKEIEITPMGELTAREFLFTYKEDSDYYNADKYKKVYNEIYGQKKYTVDNDFEKDTKKIELIFSPTPSVKEDANMRIIPHIYKVDPNSLEKSRDAFNIRILQYGGLFPSFQPGSSYNRAAWQIVDGTGATILTMVDYPYAGMFDNPLTPSRDLCFGPPRDIFFQAPGDIYPDVGLYRYYWEKYILEVGNKDSKLWKAYVLLTPSDINQLDFKRLVKVDNLYFKLNKIDGYSPMTNDVTKVELFKTIVQVEIVQPGFILHEDGGYLIHEDGSSRIPYA